MKKIAIVILMAAMVFTLSLGTSLGNMNYHKKGNPLASAKKNFYATGQTCINMSNYRGNLHHAVMKRLLKCLKTLDLADETKTGITTLFSNYKEAQEAQNQAMIDATQAYWAVLTAAVLDEAALEAAETSIVTLKNEDLELRFELMKSIRALLTEAQLAEISICFDGETDLSAQDSE